MLFAPLKRAGRAVTAALLTATAWAVLLPPAWAVDPPPYDRDWGPMWDRGGWDGWEAHAMIFSPVFALTIVAGLIILGFAIYHSFHPGGLAARHSPVANGRRILAERFARGEIDETEYRDKRKVLSKH